MRQLSAYAFQVVEWGLYLDTHPTDTNAKNQYNWAIYQENCLRNYYTTNFGPLEIRDNDAMGQEWAWIENPWPWDPEFVSTSNVGR
ncbi:spore coat protein CotJB [Gehongia tenuis]|uniref:Spore coat protein CotJB n=1 Tax=Gehongia tenuis TaxID=2763655 RepID=A0A926D5K5_9FIRM|nr:spore coat protein CotJB [Gehongia tenuis]MBC8530790.1 spore coat protein CotJB [Gehongia tenuis]